MAVGINSVDIDHDDHIEIDAVLLVDEHMLAAKSFN